MKKAILALILLLVLALQASALSEMRVPAVDSHEKGILTNILVDAQAGAGRVDVDIKPYISVDTQESIRTAAEVAASLANKNLSLFDLRFSITADASSVDGPSGGAAMAVLAYAELAGKKLRPDFSVTGTVDDEGAIGRVGGVREKLDATAQDGITLLLIARGQSASDDFDYVEYGGEISNGSLQVIETASIEEALKYAFTAAASKIAGAPSKALTELTVKKIVPSADEQPLKELASREIANARSALGSLNSSAVAEAAGSEQAGDAVMRSLKRSLDNGQTLLDNGYYYSAANVAFLTRVNLESLLLMDASDEEFGGKLDGMASQFDSLAFPAPTPQNLEWLAAAELRYYWAAWKFDAVDVGFSEDEVPVTALVKEFATANTWLSAAEGMAQNAAAAKEGAKYDELNARNYALKLMDGATQAVDDNDLAGDYEIGWHLDAAQMELADGAYIASTFDSTFVLAYAEAVAEAGNKTSRRVQSMLENESALPEFAGSAWAEAYFIHSLYNVQEANRTGDNSNLLNALKLQKLAHAWKGNAAKLAIELVSPTPYSPKAVPSPSAKPGKATPTVSQQIIVAATGVQPPEKPGVFMLVAITLLIVIVVIVFAVLISRVASRRAPSQPVAPQSMLEKLDLALAEGRLSERLYERLAARYQEKVEKKPAVKKAARKRRSKR